MSFKNIYFIAAFASVITLSLTGCFTDSDDKGDNEAIGGAVSLDFDHFVGSDELDLSAISSEEFPYTTKLGQTFNISKFGYYITQIKLIGDELEYADEVVSSADADEVKGFYQVIESEPTSKKIELNSVSYGKYTHLELTVGIPEEVVSEGAQGGILDLANGAWFWGWNSGYIGMVIEGKSPESTAKDENDSLVNTLTYHIGGWRDVEPPEGEKQKLVNNVRTFQLELIDPINVSENAAPQIHIVVDLLKIIDASGFDFAKMNALHSPAMGSSMANAFEDAFIVDHVHAH